MIKLLTTKILINVFGAPKKDASYIHKRALAVKSMKDVKELLELLGNPRFVGGHGIEYI